HVVGADIERHVSADRRRCYDDQRTGSAYDIDRGEDGRERQKQKAQPRRDKPARQEACGLLYLNELVEILVERTLARISGCIGHALSISRLPYQQAAVVPTRKIRSSEQARRRKGRRQAAI